MWSQLKTFRHQNMQNETVCQMEDITMGAGQSSQSRRAVLFKNNYQVVWSCQDRIITIIFIGWFVFSAVFARVRPRCAHAWRHVRWWRQTTTSGWWESVRQHSKTRRNAAVWSVELWRLHVEDNRLVKSTYVELLVHATAYRTSTKLHYKQSCSAL